MIKIHIPESSINMHCKKYYDDICYYLEEILSKKHIFISGNSKKYFRDFYNLFVSCNILIEPPEVLEDFIQQEKRISFLCFGGKRPNHINDWLSNLFSYSSFQNGHYIHIRGIKERDGKKNKNDKWNAWIFLESLNISICPYCNADTVYATTVVKNNEQVRIRSALDHYFPKSLYPFLAISLYNLIPTCDRCNSKIKGTRDFSSLKEYIHPYVDSFHDGIEFKKKILRTSGFMGNSDGFEIELVEKANSALSKKSKNSAQFFSIAQIYNTLFKKDAADVILKTYLGVESYRSFLLEKGISSDEIDRLIWGCSLDPTEINRNRLSKMIIDLIKSI